MNIGGVLSIVALINIVSIIVIVVLAKTTKRPTAPVQLTPEQTFKSVVASVATLVEGFDFATNTQNLETTSKNKRIMDSIAGVQSIINMFVPSNLRSNCVPNPKNDKDRILNFQWNYVDCYTNTSDILGESKRYLFASLTLVCMIIGMSLKGTPFSMTKGPDGVFSTDSRIKELLKPFLFGSDMYPYITQTDRMFVDQNKEAVIAYIAKGTTLPVETIKMISSPNYNDRITPDIAISNWITMGITIPYEMLSIIVMGYYIDFKNRLKGSTEIKRCDLIV